ncbi:DUF2069 domain-containing protein [Agarilytica rhodophyticola]|uniref:DUF2069 domain-containing protein n=1 Tax=Agarilytica rhodophyticola TaxID=1737490 RepID=UPI001FE60163|nr:DUF2069 domain-containing protein [Agarilytica rhodophyticola]
MTQQTSSTTSNRAPLERKMEYAANITYGLFAALVALILYWNITRESGFKIGIMVFQTLPLLALLPGMLQKAYRSYSWLCFLLLFYFIFAVQLVFSSIRQTSDYIFLILIIFLFVSSMMTSRWLQRWQKGAA